MSPGASGRVVARSISLVIVAAALASAGCADETQGPGPSVLERAERDDVVSVAHADPAVQRAFERARASLPGFLEHLRRPPANLEAFAVKVPLRAEGVTEYVWLNDPQQHAGSIAGTVANAPRQVATVREGQRIRVPLEDVVDWTYFDRGAQRMHGNFTGCALLAHEPAEQAAEFRRAYGLRCDE